MGSMNICASAKAVVDAIVMSGEATASETQALMTATKAHLSFVALIQSLPPCRDFSLAATYAEDSFARFLKGMADDVLARKSTPKPEPYAAEDGDKS